MSFEFSNLDPFDYPLIYQKMEFQTVENFYQAMKAKKDDLTTRRRISIQPPTQAKKMGNRIKLRPDWEEIKLDVMAYALRYKFAPYTSWADKLLATGVSEIVESNTWHDTFWGKCFCKRCLGQGENHLGRLLMSIREKLLKQKLTPKATLKEWIATEDVFKSDRLTVRIRDDFKVAYVNLRNEVGPNGAYYISRGWFGTCTCARLLTNLDFLYKGGSVIELYDPAKWGRVIKTRISTEIRPY